MQNFLKTTVKELLRLFRIFIIFQLKLIDIKRNRKKKKNVAVMKHCYNFENEPDPVMHSVCTDVQPEFPFLPIYPSIVLMFPHFHKVSHELPQVLVQYLFQMHRSIRSYAMRSSIVACVVSGFVLSYKFQNCNEILSKKSILLKINSLILT